MDRAAIIELVRGLDPVDPIQLRITADISPAQRILTAMNARAFAMAAFRGALRRRFPQMPVAELNMRVLTHFTNVRWKRE